MPLAAATGTVVAAALGGYVLLALLWFALRRRDVYGRRRPLGCLLGLLVFFGLFVTALAIWAAHELF